MKRLFNAKLISNVTNLFAILVLSVAPFMALSTHTSAQSDGTWALSGSLSIQRPGSTVTLLQNGEVLVAGGESVDGLDNTAELYNPSTGSWSYTGSLNVGRYVQTATLLQNGDVLVAGGEDSTFHILADAELYNPSTGVWSETGDMTVPRAQHTATLLYNGKVLVAGGGNNSSSYNTSSELYDPATGLWTPTGSMNDDRYSFTAILLQNGDVLVAGGYGDNLDTTRAAELYTPSPIIIPPSITYTLSSAPNNVGWYDDPVTVTFNCADNSGSRLVSCSAPVTLTSDGANQTVTGTALDNNGNSSAVTATINIDQTPPTVGAATWSTNPTPVRQSTALYVPTSDSLSGIVGGEYYIGNTDPGQGNGIPMTYMDGELIGTLGTNLGAGVYNINARSKDVAGNWSSLTSTMLVVYDSSTSIGLTGKNKKDLIPSLANGDIMPGLISSTQTDAADYGMTVQYKNGALDPTNAFHFNYSTGTHCHNNNAIDCHSFILASTSFSWLVINGTNNSQGQFEGTANVTVDGVTTANPFTVSATDGGALTPVANDYLILKVYSPGADPSAATPIYQASGSMPSGNGVVIQ